MLTRKSGVPIELWRYTRVEAKSGGEPLRKDLDKGPEICYTKIGGNYERNKVALLVEPVVVVLRTLGDGARRCSLVDYRRRSSGRMACMD